MHELASTAAGNVTTSLCVYVFVPKSACGVLCARQLPIGAFNFFFYLEGVHKILLRAAKILLIKKEEGGRRGGCVCDEFRILSYTTVSYV